MAPNFCNDMCDSCGVSTCYDSDCKISILDFNTCAIKPCPSPGHDPAHMMWHVLNDPTNCAMNHYLKIQTGCLQFNANTIFPYSADESIASISMSFFEKFKIKSESNCIYKVSDVQLYNSKTCEYVSYTKIQTGDKENIRIATDNCNKKLEFIDCVKICDEFYIKFNIPSTAIDNKCNTVRFMVQDIKITMSRVYGGGLTEPKCFDVAFNFCDVSPVHLPNVCNVTPHVPNACNLDMQNCDELKAAVDSAVDSAFEIATKSFIDLGIAIDINLNKVKELGSLIDELKEGDVLTEELLNSISGAYKDVTNAGTYVDQDNKRNYDNFLAAVATVNEKN